MGTEFPDSKTPSLGVRILVIAGSFLGLHGSHFSSPNSLEPDSLAKRSWRVGQSRSNVLKHPPGTDHNPHYYAEGEEMKERASIV